MKSVNICKILSVDEIAQGIFDVVVESEKMASEAKPGQFLHIDCGDSAKNLLRRPISICDAYDDRVRFIFERKGTGTDWLSQRREGDLLDIIGPAGNGFTVMSNAQKPIIIGGGIGVFPLYMLAKQFDKPTVLMGFRDKSRVCLESEFDKIANVAVATDDGSYGYDGYAVTILENMLKSGNGDIVYSCGPMPMLRAVKKITEQYGIRCQLSLEERMGCGIGACLTCTCETTSTGTHKHKRVCKNGPVFWSDEVTLNG